MKHIPGADPELVLLNHYYEELDVSAVLIYHGPPLKDHYIPVSMSHGLQGVYLNFQNAMIRCTATTDYVLEVIQLKKAPAN